MLENAQTPTSHTGCTETVLIIDDEEMILQAGKQMMEKMGFSVLLAKSGGEALHIYHDFHERIDMVILDMMMPDMSGAETLDSLKRIKKDVKVLLSSGYGLDEQARELMALGCADFMEKPFSMGDLLQKIRSVLGDVTSGGQGHPAWS